MLTVKQFPFSPLQENTYVIYNEQDECCIIDPGCYFGNERNELKEFIEETGLTPKYLLNTHCHLDHIFGNKFVHDTWGLTLHLHEKEKVVLDFGPTFGLNWGLPFDNYKGDLIYLREGDTVRLGEDRFIILFTPGHSPGHISFYCPEQHFIVSGDVLFRRGIGRTDLPGGDFDTLARSIREQLYTLPDETLVYNGHGPETTIGEEKRQNPFVRG
ncbi:MBL fold metallo-hydrolase [Paraflavitalea soli]|uniref:MBL fold metallo-hydrolase n=1 Tax=Paraflavitalea soli TaxID=2315862 RepID=A0A3B7MS79_9BACT|nr:MBL fold metallo-hydrolase [Paraflavitalea soli]AXY76223.1 MBL fold metallo-hydrolase [Paraflavitalea soli]